MWKICDICGGADRGGAYPEMSGLFDDKERRGRIRDAGAAICVLGAQIAGHKAVDQENGARG
jgi:hypothetical protein